MIIPPRMDCSAPLAAIHTDVDIFYNSTAKGNCFSVNLGAETCGVHVVFYDMGGCYETSVCFHSAIVEDFDGTKAALARCAERGEPVL